jgi:hypothetical protein
MNLLKRTGMPLLLAATLAGCAAGDVDALESELRVQEDTIAHLQNQLSSVTAEARAAQAETDTLRNQLAQQGQPGVILPEQAHVLFRVQRIELHKYMTGGLDKDGLPGDDAMTVLLVPQDQDGELLKVPGGIHIDLFDMTQPEDQQKIGAYDFSPDEVQQAWHSGFFGSGFMLELPLDNPPQSSKVTLHAELATADGREFHATGQFRVTPPQTANIATKPRPAPGSPPRMIRAAGPLVPGYNEVDDLEPVTPSGFEDEQPAGIPTSDRWTEQTRPTWR